jgi:hypothetical protein
MTIVTANCLDVPTVGRRNQKVLSFLNVVSAWALHTVRGIVKVRLYSAIGDWLR